MKKQLLFASIFLIVISANAQHPGFVIHGTVPGLDVASRVVALSADGHDTITTTETSNGVFTLTGKLARPDAIILSFPDLNKKAVLFIGNDVVNFSAKDPRLNDLRITGSVTQQDYETFLNEIKPLADYVSYYRMQYQSSGLRTARDSFAIMLNTAYGIYQNSIDRFINRRPESPVASLLLLFAYETDPNKDVGLLEKRFSVLKDEALQTVYSGSIKKLIETAKIGAVGTEALEFTQNDANGKPVALSSFRGKYVLVDFWASWCKPCRVENPNVVAAYHRFKDKNFTVLGVSLDQNKDRWLEAVEVDGLTWTQVSDLKYWQNEVAQLYGIESIPQNILIDPTGVIIGKNLRGDDLLNTLSSIFSK